MPEPLQYVPILKARSGELGALREVQPLERNRIIPFLDVAPWAPTSEDARPGRPFTRLVGRLASAWAESGRVLIDTSQAGAAAYEDGDPHHILARGVTEDGLRIVPVIAPHASELARVHPLLLGNGLAIRLRPANFATPPEPALSSVLAAAGVTPHDVDLVVDLGAVRSDADESSYFAAVQMLAAVAPLGAWRTLTLAASSFPVDLRAIPGSGETRVRRGEWALWRRVREARVIPAAINFGDYGVSHPDFPAGPMFQAPPNVRYTTVHEYFIAKRRKRARPGEEPGRELARFLVGTPEYQAYGPGFSWGDEEIARYAAKETKERGSGWGGPTEWRKIGTSHHLAVVAAEIRVAQP